MYCNFCHAAKEKGIKIMGKFLCSDCEKSLTYITPAEPSYLFIVKRFRNFLLKQKELW